MFDKEYSIIKEIIPRLFSKVRDDFFSAEYNFTLKKDKTFVTHTDKSVEKILISHIAANFPSDHFLSEESRTNTSWKKGRVWVLDPICGTSNFAFKIPIFTTNITLLVSGKPVLTFSLDYINQNYYWAMKGKTGVFDKNGRVDLISQYKNRIILNFGYIVSQGTRSYRKEIMNIAKDLFLNYKIKSQDYSSSLSFAYSAVNRKFAGFIVIFSKPWDFVSGAYLVQKNGGIVTDFAGNPWSCDSQNIVASVFPDVHKLLLSVIRKHWPR